MIKYIENNYPDFKNYDLIPKSYKIKSDFEKVAYEMADPVKEFIESLKPSKNSNYYWINAMGAGEIYGANNRGDFFPRKELQDHHHTFVDTPAMVYIQHRNKDPQYSLGQVLFSYFNPDNDRVELVQRIDWDKVFKSYTPEWIKYLLQGDQSFNTSMGCRVGYDQCSYCGQRNKTVADYCDHLKNHMHQWIDGVKVYAINIDPKFFDNSIVRRGADRTARSLKKVASMESEIESIQSDSELIEKKYFFNNYGITPTINESNINKIAANTIALEKTDLDSLCEFNLAEILGTTKIAGCELLPHEFQYIVLSKMGQEKLANKYWKEKERFEIPNTVERLEPIALQFNDNVFTKLSSFIPEKTFYTPFLIQKSLTKEASTNYDFYLKNDPLLDFIGKSYVDYQLNKVADVDSILANITPKLLLMFLTNLLPWKALSDSKDINNQATNRELFVIKDLKYHANKAPIVANPEGGVYNPIVYRNNLMMNKTASLDLWALKKGLKPTLKYGPAVAISAGTTSLLVGKNKEDEISGEDPGALTTFARKHPIATTLGGAAILQHGLNRIKSKFKKTASEDFKNSYKSYLKDINIEPEVFLDIVSNMPDELFNEIIL